MTSAPRADQLSDDEVRALIASVPHWQHRMELRPGIITPGVSDSAEKLKLLNVPADCSGLRVLDIGAMDGFFAFELERRGADVLAVDFRHPERDCGFAIAARVLGSSVQHLLANLYHLRPAQIGTFDLVLFLGVLYHLPDPLGALRIIRTLCRPGAKLYVETVIIDNGILLEDGRTELPLAAIDPRLTRIPLARFFAGDTLNHDASNYWGPNIQCVRDLLAETEFDVVRVNPLGGRAAFECRATSRPQLAWVMKQYAGVE